MSAIPPKESVIGIPMRRYWVLAFALITLMLLAGGHRYYRMEAEQVSQGNLQTITAIAGLKSAQLQEVLESLLSNAKQVAQSPFVAQALEGLIRHPGNEALRAGLMGELKLQQQLGLCSEAWLLDLDGKLLLATSERPAPVSSATRQAIQSVRASGGAALTDIFKVSDNRISLEAAALVKAGGGRPAGFLIFRSDVTGSLSALLDFWPAPGRTNETLLVTRDGGDVLFLNRQARRNGRVSLDREPLTKKQLPAVQAVLGKRGYYRGTDYRGADVIADLRPVPGTPWFMVTKIDAAEFLADAREEALVVGLFVAFLILLTAAGLISVYGRLRTNLIREHLAERKAVEVQLQRTVSDLEHSNKELEQFAYIASHDLQEPLRMVSSYTQLLAQRYDDRLDDKARKYIRYAVDGAIRMQTLINDLLVYSRVGTRGLPLEPADVHVVLGEAIRNLAATITESQAIITNGDLPTVRADGARLVLVFQNLLANAIKFRGKDRPCIHVSAREGPDEWVFAVKDNGIGIEPQHAERVFVIFQRLHTREEYPGTGIGLAVCQRIVERHGGKIRFASEPGTGTTFFFTIPK